MAVTTLKGSVARCPEKILLDRLLPVVWMAAQECGRAIELFRDDDSRQSVWQCHGAEIEHEIGALQDLRRMPIRAANQNREIRNATIQGSSEEVRKFVARQRFPAFIQCDDRCVRGDRPEQSTRFIGLSVDNGRRAALCQFNFTCAANADLSPGCLQPFPVALEQGAIRAGLELADGSENDTHEGGPAEAASVRRRFRRSVTRPHFFEVVEGPHFRTENMDDRCTNIDHDPVARLHAFDPEALYARLF